MKAFYLIIFRSAVISASPCAMYLRLLKGNGAFMKRFDSRRRAGEFGEEQDI
jgi:hypothetical protein